MADDFPPSEQKQLSEEEEAAIREEVKLAFCGIEAMLAMRSATRACIIAMIIVVLVTIIGGTPLKEGHFITSIMFALGWGYGSYISKMHSMHAGLSNFGKELLVQWAPLIAAVIAMLILSIQGIAGPIMNFASLMVFCVVALGKPALRDALYNASAPDKK